MEKGLGTDMRRSTVLLGRRGVACASGIVCAAWVVSMLIGCDRSPGSATEKVVYAKMNDLAKRYYGAILNNGESPVFRGNALAVTAQLAKHPLDADSPPMLVSAAIGTVGSDSPHKTLYLLCMALAPNQRRTQGVFLFVTGKGRTVVFTFQLKSSERPEEFAGFATRAVSVNSEQLAGLGKEDQRGVLHVDRVDYDRANPGASLDLPVPEGDVAVGLCYPDGTYTNFVPLVRCAEGKEPYEPPW